MQKNYILYLNEEWNKSKFQFCIEISFYAESFSANFIATTASPTDFINEESSEDFGWLVVAGDIVVVDPSNFSGTTVAVVDKETSEELPMSEVCVVVAFMDGTVVVEIVFAKRGEMRAKATTIAIQTLCKIYSVN